MSKTETFIVVRLFPNNEIRLEVSPDLLNSPPIVIVVALQNAIAGFVNTEFNKGLK